MGHSLSNGSKILHDAHVNKVSAYFFNSSGWGFFDMTFSNPLFLDKNLWNPAHEKSQLALENSGIPSSLHSGGILRCSSPEDRPGIPLIWNSGIPWILVKKYTLKAVLSNVVKVLKY